MSETWWTEYDQEAAWTEARQITRAIERFKEALVAWGASIQEVVGQMTGKLRPLIEAYVEANRMVPEPFPKASEPQGQFSETTRQLMGLGAIASTKVGRQYASWHREEWSPDYGRRK